MTEDKVFSKEINKIEDLEGEIQRYSARRSSRLKILKVGSRDGVFDVQKHRVRRGVFDVFAHMLRVAYWPVHVFLENQG